MFVERLDMVSGTDELLFVLTGMTMKSEKYTDYPKDKLKLHMVVCMCKIFKYI